MKISEWTRTDTYVQYIIECKAWEKDKLFYWCEENIQRHSSIPYDPDWRWNFGRGPAGTMIYTFRNFEDAIAFKLRWM